ncbi:toprim domain-containing protein [Maribellus maritimus]|uniref:toprim domain-containing protein n=1 Tax=Maribellus maritimus TaxID=2870838 RepID=UPI001EEC8646|nr:toprim domain-containing protein [Maribellus maritimus]MCG6188591.1 toprim domain-containing protein [Maribellus maritimus]
MALSDIKQISIREYLRNKSILPKKDFGYYGMYFCPFREDHNTSFKVDYRKNIWYDFGTNEGGSIIDLDMKMNNCTFHEAATRLEKDFSGRDLNFFSFHRGNTLDKKKNNETSIIIHDISEISHRKLIEWVNARKIDLSLANLYCREVHYQVRNRVYFSVGFENDKGGYELSSSPSFKGCIPPKEITTMKSGHETCLAFEGFWDFLSYLTLQKTDKTRYDVVILNSVANIKKALPFLKEHKNICAFLDNDESGRKAFQMIKLSCFSVDDMSIRYTGYKDLNDYLCGKKQVQEMKKSRGFRL